MDQRAPLVGSSHLHPQLLHLGHVQALLDLLPQHPLDDEPRANHGSLPQEGGCRGCWRSGRCAVAHSAKVQRRVRAVLPARVPSSPQAISGPASVGEGEAAVEGGGESPWGGGYGAPEILCAAQLGSQWCDGGWKGRPCAHGFRIGSDCRGELFSDWIGL